MELVLGMFYQYWSICHVTDAITSRWLVHSIATYYDLNTWSVTKGHPARREAYVGLKSGRPATPTGTLPRPLWGMV